MPATEEPTLSVPLEENETSSAAVTDESAEVQNETPQKPTQADLDAEMQGLATWVKEQHGAGHKVTGASVAEYIGKSPRTESSKNVTEDDDLGFHQGFEELTISGTRGYC